MADEQDTPDAVVTIRTPEKQRCVAVGSFGRSFEIQGDEHGATHGIKAIWRNETGPFNCAAGKTVLA